jgi:hypothetical protein
MFSKQPSKEKPNNWEYQQSRLAITGKTQIGVVINPEIYADMLIIAEYYKTNNTAIITKALEEYFQ